MATQAGQLLDFLEHLQREIPDLTQRDIARKAKLSQATANKIFRGRGREPAPATWRAITEAFPKEWQAYLGEHESLRERLEKAHMWVHASAIRDYAPDQEAVQLIRQDPAY